MKFLKILFLSSLFFELAGARSSIEYEQQFVGAPTDYRALYNAGVMAFKENNVAHAQELFNCLKPICEQQTWDATAGEQLFYNAGNAEMKLQKYDDAIASFEKVLHYNPENEKAREKLEYAKKMKEKKEEEKKDDKKKDKDKQDDKKDKKQDKKDQDKQEEQKQDKDEQQKQQENKEQQEQKKDKGEKENQGQDDKEQKEKSGKDQKDKQEQEEQKQEKSGGDKKEQKQNKQPDLSQQEEELLAQIQTYEQHQQQQVEARRLQKVRGTGYAQNNW